MRISNIDSVDRKILNVLQHNSRISNVDLAETIGLSPSPCLARVKALSESGLIKKHVTLLDPLKLGLSLNVFIQISLVQQTKETLERFEQSIAELPEVLECYLMTGDSDYLLRVAVADVHELGEFILNHLSRSEEISNIRSSLSIKQVKYETALPIPRSVS
ncbi:MAG: Lrp/AsnC family transcriptional regulator [Pseudomonadota bacterium]